jgi:hypothetical protein
MYSTTFQSEAKTIGRKELFEWALGIEMTLYVVQEMGMRLELIKLLSILNKRSRVMVGRCFSIKRGIQSMPEAADLREEILLFSSPRVKGRLKQWAGDNCEYVVEGLG